MTYSESGTVATIVRAIEAEQNLVYAAGLAGAFLSGAPRRQVIVQLAEHQDRIAVLSALIAPESVPAAAPAYAPPTPITDARTARTNMAQLNNALVGIYADLAAATKDADRAYAIDLARICARTAVQWGSSSQAFPT